MVRKFAVAAVLLTAAGLAGSPSLAQTGQTEKECAIYAQQTCASPNWQQLGYSSNTACRNAYFNHCNYGDPLEPLAYRPAATPVRPGSHPA